MKYIILFILIIQLSQAHTFEVTYPVPAKKPFYAPTVYVAICSGMQTPKARMDNFVQPPILLSVVDKDRDGKVVIDEKALSSVSPKQLLQLNRKLMVQAVVRIHPAWYLPGGGEGDIYSKLRVVDFESGKVKKLTIKADQVVPAPKFRKKGPVQDHYLKSELLSKFHQHPYHLRYTVVLPENWDKSKKYPVLFYVPGFSTPHQKASGTIRRWMGEKSKQVILVVADANCRWGHSVYADSAVNGPWGQALIKELIPHIDQTYGGAGAEHRYITGLSSGGWASAWVMVNYPEHFAGGWPVSPDPVDFTAFQEIDLSADPPQNIYKTEDGEDRCFSVKRLGMKYKRSAQFERALISGSQFQSFGATFSPQPVESGNPLSAPPSWFDYETGEINQDVVAKWAPYDISRLMKKKWKTLEPKLKGKLHFGIHQQDVFLLDHAVRKLEQQCKKLGSDATFTYFRGMGHSIPQQHAAKMMDTILTKWQQTNPSNQNVEVEK